MILSVEDFAEGIRHLDHKITYLRLMGLDAIYDSDTNTVRISGMV